MGPLHGANIWRNALASASALDLAVGSAYIREIYVYGNDDHRQKGRRIEGKGGGEGGGMCGKLADKKGREGTTKGFLGTETEG